MIHAWLQDVRYALRLLIKAPGYAVAAVLTFAFGVGPNVALFGVLYGVLLRPLPYADGDRLILPRAETQYTGARQPTSIRILANELPVWQQPIDAIGARAFYASSAHGLSRGADSDVLQTTIVSDQFFATLAGPFVAGRPLGPADDGAAVAVISERLARRLFGGAETAIGRGLTLTAQSYTVVGVTAPDFQFPSADVDAWLPAGHERSVNPRCCGFSIVARLADDGTIGRAQNALEAKFRGAAAAAGLPAGRLQTTVVPLLDAMVAPIRPVLIVLFASVLMVLAIASGNLINLLLARNAARAAEFAMRGALGASAGRLMRLPLIETTLVAAMGTVVGVLIARVLLGVLATRVGDLMPRLPSIRLDSMVLLFAVALALVTALATGLIPA